VPFEAVQRQPHVLHVVLVKTIADMRLVLAAPGRHVARDGGHRYISCS
jgi:hypothetical protein